MPRSYGRFQHRPRLVLVLGEDEMEASPHADPIAVPRQGDTIEAPGDLGRYLVESVEHAYRDGFGYAPIIYVRCSKALS